MDLTWNSGLGQWDKSIEHSFIYYWFIEYLTFYIFSSLSHPSPDRWMISSCIYRLPYYFDFNSKQKKPYEMCSQRYWKFNHLSLCTSKIWNTFIVFLFSPLVLFMHVYCCSFFVLCFILSRLFSWISSCLSLKSNNNFSSAWCCSLKNCP